MYYCIFAKSASVIKTITGIKAFLAFGDTKSQCSASMVNRIIKTENNILWLLSQCPCYGESNDGRKNGYAALVRVTWWALLLLWHLLVVHLGISSPHGPVLLSSFAQPIVPLPCSVR